MSTSNAVRAQKEGILIGLIIGPEKTISIKNHSLKKGPQNFLFFNCHPVDEMPRVPNYF
jgi:hypothetical protein